VQPGGYADGSLDSASGRAYFLSSLSGLDVVVKDAKCFDSTDNEYLEELHLRRDIRTFHGLHRLAV
jgi:hypothetical protein